jgi:hypothetical protein
MSRGQKKDDKQNPLTVSSSVDPKDKQFLSAREGTEDAEGWVTGDEDMTIKQDTYLQDLCKKTGETYDSKWSKGEASKKIQELRAKLKSMKHPQDKNAK